MPITLTPKPNTPTGGGIKLAPNISGAPTLDQIKGFQQKNVQAKPLSSDQEDLQSLKGVFSSVADAAKSGVSQAKEGYNRAKNAMNNPSILGGIGDLLSGGTKLAAGTINTLLSPAAPLMKPVGDIVNIVADKVSDNPTVQKIANSKVGDITSKVVDFGSDVNTIFGGVGLSMQFPKINVGSKSESMTPPPKPEDVTGKIIQGDKTDIPVAQKQLTSIDTTKIKTYSDLSSALDEKIKSSQTQLDTQLENSPIHTKPLKIGDMEASMKVGDQTIRHNFVEDSIDQLKKFYDKTKDVKNLARINQLETKGNDIGLTVKELNELAKEHGRVLNAYNANGELASGLSRQAAENTRAGLKTTAREIYGDESYKASDKQVSELIKTKGLIDDVATKVNDLQQKVTQRGWGEKVGRLVFQVIDKITGGGVKGFIQSFVPRGEGLKIMNALDLEKALSKNLKLLNEAVNAKTPEEATIKLNSILSDGQSSLPFLNSQPTTQIKNNQPQNDISNMVSPKQ